jgi:uncharacterized protein
VRIAQSVALVSGASFGIGAATARALAARGARILLLARTEASLRAVAAEIVETGGVADLYPVDLTDADAVERVARRILAEVGPPDVIVHSAGSGRWLSVDETEPRQVVEMMAAPYFAAFYLTRAFLPAMLQRRSGQIVVIQSIAARLVWPGAAAYTAARWALQGFTNSLRSDLRGTGLGVTTVMPGTVRSTYFTHNPGVETRIPPISRIARSVSPEEVAKAVVDGIEGNRREVLLPSMLHLFCLLNTLSPRLVTWLCGVRGYKRLTAPLGF